MDTENKMVAATQPNSQLALKNINNWMATLGSDVKTHEHESRLTIRETFRSMSINEMIRVHGAKRSDVMIIVDLQLARFLNSINIRDQLNDAQKTEIVMTLVERYPHETLNDFLLMFRMVRHGHFGPIYNRMDITIISEYMTKYLEQKAFERENIERQHMKEFLDDSSKQTFESQEQFNEWKKQWYSERMKLREKLDAIENKWQHAKRHGSAALFDDPKKELEYQKFKNERIQNGLINNMGDGGGVERNVHPGTNENISVSESDGGGNVEQTGGEGSQPDQQNNGVPS